MVNCSIKQSMWLPRVYQNLETYFQKGKVLVIYGPRRVGKTTLLQNFLKKYQGRYLSVTGDDLQIQETLSSQSVEKIGLLAQGYDLLIIDEAQRVPSIGWGLKILVDHFPNTQVIATGSASFDLQNKVGEPLMGRKKILTLYPVSQLELKQIFTQYELYQQVENRLIFGSYPEIITAQTDAERISVLNEITNSYLFKDILDLERIKSAKILVDLLRLLAFQIGQEVSHSELGTSLGLDKNTIARYLDLLEKSFILINIRGYSRNLRKEITKKSKYYFFDTGVRNSLIANFNRLSLRNDLGQLWENFLVIERIKKQNYQPIYANSYFWRTWDQKELDFVEEREGQLFAYEFKWARKEKVKIPADFQTAYPKAKIEVVDSENYLEFVA